MRLTVKPHELDVLVLRQVLLDGLELNAVLIRLVGLFPSVRNRAMIMAAQRPRWLVVLVAACGAPMMTWPEAELFERHVADATYFEYGAGGTTALASAVARSVTSGFTPAGPAAEIEAHPIA